MLKHFDSAISFQKHLSERYNDKIMNYIYTCLFALTLCYGLEWQ